MIEGWHRRATTIIASTNFGGKGIARQMDKLWPVKKEKPDLTNARKQLERFKELEKQRNAGHRT